ncbi:hypothetical protein [Methylomonas sp. YC3]
MKKTLFPAIGMLLAGLASSGHAAVTTIDFNSIALHPTNHEISVPKPYLEDGFKLSTLAGVSFQLSGGTLYAIMPASPYWTGSVGLYSGVVTNQGSVFLLEKQDGGSFDLLSMDAASFWTIASGRQFSVYGYPQAGGFVSQSFLLDGTTNTLETLYFNDSFKNLNKIIFSSTYAQVDNIKLGLPSPISSVPLPGAAWPLLSGLGLISRRNITKALRWSR